MYNALKISYHLIINYYTLFTILNHLYFSEIRCCGSFFNNICRRTLEQNQKAFAGRHSIIIQETFIPIKAAVRNLKFVSFNFSIR